MKETTALVRRQIGELQGQPEEEPHISAYQGALEGEISIVTFQDPFGD